MDGHLSLGRSGEDEAAALYRRLGFEVVDRNYRCGAGEIDLVATRGREIVFCEVKTRVSDTWGEPSEAVGWRKQARLRRLAAHWLSERRARGCRVRFDVVSVIVRGARFEVTHIVDAF